MLRIGILVSGRGSNLAALIRAFPRGHPLIEIALVLSNRPGCPALAQAQEAGIACAAFDRRAYETRAAQQAAMAARCLQAGAGLLVLAGFDQILTSALLDPFDGRAINIHPSLLPAFAGSLHAQRDALAYGVKVSGCTVHFVTAAVDGGPIIAQAAVPVLDDDDEATLAARILQEEHRLLPDVVARIASGRIIVKGRRVSSAAG